MINRKLIQALNQPWLIEPEQSQKWAAIALDLLLQPNAAVNPVSNYSNTESVPYIKDGIMVLPVNGPLMKYESCGSPGTSNMVASLQQAIANPDIKGIVLQIDSPGGTVDGTKVFADAIKASKKPVVAFVDGMMASAAMWIGSAASTIIASTNTDMVGSIGTMMQWADFTEAYKAKGIAIHTAYATESTDKNRIYSNAAATGNYTELQQTMLDPVNNEFITAVQNNRSEKLNLQKENVLTGKVYMAKDAIKHGLVDRIGTLESAIKTASKLATTKQNITMEATTAFPNVLTAAQAQSFELVDNVGFALTEEQLTALDSRIATLLTENDSAATAQDVLAEQVAQLTNAKNAAEATIASNALIIEGLTAKLTEYGYKPAAAAGALPGAAADPGASVEDKFLTSADRERMALQKKYSS